MAADEKQTDEENSKDAFETLLMYSGVLKEDIDYKAELREARIEKYESAD